jgi:uncharacterized BrkB/YihY/UPF0761 family membrane protein
VAVVVVVLVEAVVLAVHLLVVLAHRVTLMVETQQQTQVRVVAVLGTVLAEISQVAMALAVLFMLGGRSNYGSLRKG